MGKGRGTVMENTVEIRRKIDRKTNSEFVRDEAKETKEENRLIHGGRGGEISLERGTKGVG